MAKYPIPENTIDPRDPSYYDIPLWVVYGFECFPQILACKINKHPAYGATVWGLSIHRRSLGYRTLGISIDIFERENKITFMHWFTDQSAAIEYLRQLTASPK